MAPKLASSETASRAGSQNIDDTESIISEARHRRPVAKSTIAKHASAGGGFWIIAIAEGRGQGEIGFAALDMKTCG